MLIGIGHKLRDNLKLSNIFFFFSITLPHFSLVDFILTGLNSTHGETLPMSIVSIAPTRRLVERKRGG